MKLKCDKCGKSQLFEGEFLIFISYLGKMKTTSTSFFNSSTFFSLFLLFLILVGDLYSGRRRVYSKQLQLQPFFVRKIQFLKKQPQNTSNKAQLGVLGVLQATRIFKTCFELPKPILHKTFLHINHFSQHTALVNASLTSVGRVLGYLFHLSSYMVQGLIQK